MSGTMVCFLPGPAREMYCCVLIAFGSSTDVVYLRSHMRSVSTVTAVVAFSSMREGNQSILSKEPLKSGKADLEAEKFFPSWIL